MVCCDTHRSVTLEASVFYKHCCYCRWVAILTEGLARFQLWKSSFGNEQQRAWSNVSVCTMFYPV